MLREKPRHLTGPVSLVRSVLCQAAGSFSHQHGRVVEFFSLGNGRSSLICVKITIWMEGRGLVRAVMTRGYLVMTRRLFDCELHIHCEFHCLRSSNLTDSWFSSGNSLHFRISRCYENLTLDEHIQRNVWFTWDTCCTVWIKDTKEVCYLPNEFICKYLMSQFGPGWIPDWSAKVARRLASFEFVASELEMQNGNLNLTAMANVKLPIAHS